MPEGHTLHRIARHLERVVVGTPWRVSSPQGRFVRGAQVLDGQIPRRAEAWGKHLFVHVDSAVWHVHLGLYGAFSFRGEAEFAAEPTFGAPRAGTVPQEYPVAGDGWIEPGAPQGAVRARIHVPSGWADLRGPSACEVLDGQEYTDLTARLGPDPLLAAEGRADHCAEAFASNLRTRRVGIGAALMDQRVIAGIGNIYRAESLFCERISPDIPARELEEHRVRALWERLCSQLQDGVREGRIVTVRTPHAGSAQGPSQAGAESLPQAEAGRRHYVYKHQGTACVRCSATVQARDLQGRTLYWCPGCQR